MKNQPHDIHTTIFFGRKIRTPLRPKNWNVNRTKVWTESTSPVLINNHGPIGCTPNVRVLPWYLLIVISRDS